MKKSKLIASILCSLSLLMTGIAPQTVMADTSSRVVTLGADLSQEQKNVMMKYFKVNPNEVEIINVTNRDERSYLSSYIPLSKIGNRTVSCAYVKPTTSGGIKVRTANLNYVTCNMIASTLSTSGVKNCEVVAACPFEVSGTGALTGITMAYEKASGQKLDPQKKETAVKEMVVTGNLSNEINNSKDAINIINSGKMEIIGSNIQNADEIHNVVVNIVQQNNYNISDEVLKQIVELLKEIADQDYKYDDVKETLENVESNVNEEVREEKENEKAEETEEPADEDSILNDLDAEVLGSDVFESSTEDPELEIETAPEEPVVNWDYIDPETVAEENQQILEQTGEVLDNPFEETVEEVSAEIEEGSDEGFEEFTEEAEEDELDLEALTEDEKEKFEHFETFLKGELEGSVEEFQKEMGPDTYPASLFLSDEETEKLTKDMLKMYYTILKDGTDSFIPNEDDVYFSAELNMVIRELKEILLLTDYVDTENYMYEVAEEDRKAIMEDTVKFFEKLYNETAPTAEEPQEEESYDDGYSEDSYEEEYQWDEVYEETEQE